MPVSSNSRAIARLVATLGLAAVCVNGSVARSSPLLRFAALDPAHVRLEETPVPVPAPRGPFGMTTSVDNIYSARWKNLQPMLRIEAQIMALCRTNPDGCPDAASKFLRLVDAAHALEGRARVGEINRAVNLTIRPMSDQAQYGVPEFWASPLTSFGSGAGDCEDYAIAKYVALREAGVAAEDLRLVVVRNGQDDHAVAAARVDGDWLILDNRHMRLLPDREAIALTPLFALSGEPTMQAPATAAVPAAIPEFIASELSV